MWSHSGGRPDLRHSPLESGAHGAGAASLSGALARPRQRLTPAEAAALAIDYDRTLADPPPAQAEAVRALAELRAAGRRVVLVTGRDLEDLRRVQPDLTPFDRVVAENGALILDVAGGLERFLVGPPPAPLQERLRRRGVPFRTGRCILATVVPHDRALSEVIDELRCDYRLIYNRESVMAVPSGVDKATGLEAALSDLGLDLAQTIAVGDGENDEAMIVAAGLGVAVANAVHGLRSVAEMVTQGAAGAGVAEIARLMLLPSS